jgi:cytochrome d ubiquinol oxidase subunit II
MKEDVMNEYELFRIIWWALLGVLLIGLAVMDGFDLGAAMLAPIIGRSDSERRVVINTVGPVWEGNQVWLILGGGAIFAAWPMLYAVAFSGFYFAMLLLLVALILRPVGFKYRSKLKGQGWRNFWDGALFVGGLVPALVYGVAFGNVLQGVPFTFDNLLRLDYQGGFFALFNPFALLCGIISVAMLLMHGGAYVACKTDGAIRARARKVGSLAGVATIALFAGAGVWASQINGYLVTSFAGTDAPSNMLTKTVARLPGGLFANYHAAPLIMIVPAVAFLGAALTILMMYKSARPGLTFIASGFAVAGIIGTAGVSLFPFLLPSSSDPNASLIVWDSSSGLLTLQIMLASTIIFLPIVLLYTSWVYYVMRGPVTVAGIEANDHNVY